MRLLLFLVLLLNYHPIFSQFLVKGQVLDQSQQPLAFATVSWHPTQDSLEVQGVICDENGNFQINKIAIGKYKFQFQMIGYQTNEITLTIENDLNLGFIELQSTIANLDEVVVSAQRSYLESHPGKRVLYIGQDIGTIGSTVAEALEMVPSVTTNARGEVVLRGSSSFRIYINGKPTNREPRSLQFINADALQRIEVITNPSAKYDAEGITGIINLVFRKNRSRRFKLDAFVNGTLPRRLNSGINLSAGKKTLSFYANVTNGWSWYKNQDQQERFNKNSFLLRSNNSLDYEGFQVQPTLTSGINFNPDSTIAFNLEMNFVRWDAIEDIQQISLFDFDGANAPRLQLKNKADELEDEGSISIQMEKTLAPKRKIKALFSVGGENENNSNVYNVNNISLDESPLANNIQNSATNETQRYYRLNFDFETPIRGIGNLELGTQFDFTRFAVLQQQAFFGDTLTRPDNDFRYKVWKPAAYALIKKKWDKLQYEVGIRAEYFRSDANQISIESSFQQEFFNVFPSLGLVYKIHKDGTQSLGLNYTRRINTPGFFDINPFVTITDPLNQWAGNPELKPEFSNLLELNYLQSWSKVNLDLTLFGNNTKDIIQQVVQKIDDQQSLQSYQNFGRRNTFGSELQITYQPNELLKFDHTLSWDYTEFKSNSNLIMINRRGAWRARFKQQLRIKEKWLLDFSEYYRSTRIEPQSKDLAQFYVDIGLRKSFQDGRGTLSINFRDVFNTRVFRSILFGDDFILENRFKFQTRRITLGLKYKIWD